MEKSLKEALEYETRARKEIKEAKDHLKREFLETVVSTAYYSCFYAIHSQLARLGILAKSHKQAGIEFRRHFIRTNKMDKKYSKIWTELSKWRLTADYTAIPVIDKNKAAELLDQAGDFVDTLLVIKN